MTRLAISTHGQLVLLEQTAAKQRELLAHLVGQLDLTSLAEYDRYREMYDIVNNIPTPA
jgi:hypothetical protein